MKMLKTPSTSDVYTRVGLLGFVAGLRSQVPLFLLAVAARRGDFARDQGRPLSLLRSRGAIPVLGAAVLVELVGDKLPMAPSRLGPPSLSVRLLIGALTGAAITRDAGTSVLAGGALGAVAAGVGSVAGNRFRAVLPRLAHLPPVGAAIVEDATALGLGWFAGPRAGSSTSTGAQPWMA